MITTLKPMLVILGTFLFTLCISMCHTINPTDKENENLKPDSALIKCYKKQIDSVLLRSESIVETNYQETKKIDSLIANKTKTKPVIIEATPKNRSFLYKIFHKY